MADFFANPMTIFVSPKPSAFLSIISSYTLIREVVEDLRHKTPAGMRARADVSKPLSRTLICMSIADLFFSVPWFLGTWVAPAGGEAYFAAGTQATCTWSACWFQFGTVASPIFNVVFAFYSLLMLRYNWTDKQIADRLEPWVMGAIWTVAVTCAIFPIPLDLYNEGFRICWINANPFRCTDDDSCRGGLLAENLSYWFVIFPTWPCIFAALVIIIMIYATVRRNENRMSRYAGSRVVSQSILQSMVAGLKTSILSRASQTGEPMQPTSRESADGAGSLQSDAPTVRRDRSRAVAKQAIWYMTAFLVTYSLDMVSYSLWQFQGFVYYDALDFFAYVLYPLQGFFNFIIFCRPRKVMKTPEGRILRKVFCFVDLCKSDDKSRSRNSSFPNSQISTKLSQNDPPSGVEQNSTEDVQPAPMLEPSSLEYAGADSDNDDDFNYKPDAEDGDDYEDYYDEEEEEGDDEPSSRSAGDLGDVEGNGAVNRVAANGKQGAHETPSVDDVQMQRYFE